MASSMPWTAVFTIAHISDLHCGGPYFVPNLLERAIGEINDLKPDMVICTGDLTTFGFRPEYDEAKSYLDGSSARRRRRAGKHDSRTLGFSLRELFGERYSVHHRDGVTVVAADSTEPDLDHGQIGRGRYRWIEEQFATEGDPAHFRASPPSLPCRYRSRAECRLRRGRRDRMSPAAGSTVCSPATSTFRMRGDWRTSSSSTRARVLARLRGNTRPVYNLVEIDGTHVDVWRKYRSTAREDHPVPVETLAFEKYTSRIEREVTTRS